MYEELYEPEYEESQDELRERIRQLEEDLECCDEYIAELEEKLTALERITAYWS